FVDKTKRNGEFLGVIKRKETITNILSGNVFNKIILNSDKEYGDEQDIKVNLTYKENTANLTKSNHDYIKLRILMDNYSKKKREEKTTDM
ncbi:phosphatidylinositol transfer protein, putative, partial [Plasmodium malariae]